MRTSLSTYTCVSSGIAGSQDEDVAAVRPGVHSSLGLECGTRISADIRRNILDLAEGPPNVPQWSKYYPALALGVPRSVPVPATSRTPATYRNLNIVSKMFRCANCSYMARPAHYSPPSPLLLVQVTPPLRRRTAVSVSQDVPFGHVWDHSSFMLVEVSTDRASTL